MWVVSHHLSASAWPSTPLAMFSRRRCISGSKPATSIKALILAVKGCKPRTCQSNRDLELPLLEYDHKPVKDENKSIWIILDRNKQKKSEIACFGHKIVSTSTTMLAFCEYAYAYHKCACTYWKHASTCFLWTTMHTYTWCTRMHTPSMRMHGWN